MERKKWKKIPSLLFGWDDDWKIVVISQLPHFLIFINQFYQQSPFFLKKSPLTIWSTIFLQIFISLISCEQFPLLTIIDNHIISEITSLVKSDCPLFLHVSKSRISTFLLFLCCCVIFSFPFFPSFFSMSSILPVSSFHINFERAFYSILRSSYYPRLQQIIIKTLRAQWNGNMQYPLKL